MEVEESNVVDSSRKRRESNGGSSDSDLSEGWNVVDHLDDNSPEAPSSDGESVEVIEAEEGSSVQDADSDKEVDVPATETAEQVSATALVSADQLPAAALHPPREEMFDSSFCWFMLAVSLALMCSHLAFLAAESVFALNTPYSGSPSFLKDLPIMPKSLSPSSCSEKVSWASDEDVIIVDSIDNKFTKATEKTVIHKSSTPTDEKLQETKNANVEERPTLQIDNQDFGKYLKVLSDMSISAEAQKKFAQSMLILDALHIGIGGLEGAVPESSELKMLLKKQKNKLNDVLIEVKFGVSRSMDRLATNVLNKVETLEKRFENQWCKLEKNGHKEELKGLFYDCDESRNLEKTIIRSDKKYKDKSKIRIDINKKKHRKMRIIEDNYKYEVDKDSTGKVYRKENNENGAVSSEYYKLVNDGKKNKDKQKLQDSLNYDKADKKTSKMEVKKENNFVKDGKKNKENYNPQDVVGYNKNEKKMSAKESKKENQLKNLGKQLKEQYYERKDENSEDSKDRQYEKPVTKKSAEEVLGRFFKEMCAKVLKNHNSSTNLKNYHKLKEEVDKKLRISKKLFDHLYFKFCEQNLGDAKENNKREKEYLKKDYKDNIFKKENNFRNNQLIIEDPDEKDIKFKIIESLNINSRELRKSDNLNNRVVESASLQEWTYENPPCTNKTDLDGYWFLKAGESRSHIRWFHQRSDWWFDRASQRRHNQYSYPHPSSWYVGRYKNWFFRRAWARQQCRVSLHNSWCRLNDETVTVSNTNFS